MGNETIKACSLSSGIFQTLILNAQIYMDIAGGGA